MSIGQFASMGKTWLGCRPERNITYSTEETSCWRLGGYNFGVFTTKRSVHVLSLCVCAVTLILWWAPTAAKEIQVGNEFEEAPAADSPHQPIGGNNFADGDKVQLAVHG